MVARRVRVHVQVQAENHQTRRNVQSLPYCHRLLQQQSQQSNVTHLHAPPQRRTAKEMALVGVHNECESLSTKKKKQEVLETSLGVYRLQQEEKGMIMTIHVG